MQQPFSHHAGRAAVRTLAACAALAAASLAALTTTGQAREPLPAEHADAAASAAAATAAAASQAASAAPAAVVAASATAAAATSASAASGADRVQPPRTDYTTAPDRVPAPRQPVGSTGADPTAAAVPADPLAARGLYVARAANCVSCHTRPGGKPFAGGLPMATPFGTIYSTNITPDRAQGIGTYTRQQFDEAVRRGRAPEHLLYPAMPYANYAHLTQDDVDALYHYLMHAVPAVQQDNKTTDLPWPFSMRWLMNGWNLLYRPSAVGWQADAAQSAEWNRGAYLVLGAGHCGACHTPRGAFGAEKAATQAKGDAFLSGALIDGWWAPSLRNESARGLRSWSDEELVTYFRSGRNAHSAAFGPMTEVIENSTQHLTDGDLKSIASYLRTLGASDGSAPLTASARVPGQGPEARGQDQVALALRSGKAESPGARVYLNNCAACHRSDGRGADRTFPTLAGSSSVAARDATSLIRMVLQGSEMPATRAAPSALGMPGFGWRLTDENVADLLTFVRSSWGNAAPAVAAADVAKVRTVVGRAGGRDAPQPTRNTQR